MLEAVAQQGSISAAARTLGMSYRHVWGALKRWEEQLGGELIIWGKGQSAQLSEFGTKLLWAERQAQARLAPQIAALHADLERAFAVAFDDSAHVLTMYASHDDALASLRAHAATPGTSGALHLDIRFTGSVDAIRALNEGRCTLAGFHTLEQPAATSLAARTYKPLLQPGLHKIIGFARRTQGLIVAKGNPLGLQSLTDVARTGARFANRPLGSGTRVLLEDLLAQEGLTGQHIAGFERDETSHTAVAQAVVSGAADVGWGSRWRPRARAGLCPPGGRALPPGLPEGNAGATSHPRASGVAAHAGLARPPGEPARVFTHAQRAGAGDEQRPALVGFHAPQASFCA
jgi:putative molybdopterin biosynthesis protein